MIWEDEFYGVSVGPTLIKKRTGESQYRTNMLQSLLYSKERGFPVVRQWFHECTRFTVTHRKTQTTIIPIVQTSVMLATTVVNNRIKKKNLR